MLGLDLPLPMVKAEAVVCAASIYENPQAVASHRPQPLLLGLCFVTEASRKLLEKSGSDMTALHPKSPGQLSSVAHDPTFCFVFCIPSFGSVFI